jgi:hypothetical protein
MIAILQLIINNGASILPSLKKVILGEAQNYPMSIPGRINQLVPKKGFHSFFFLIMEGIL